MSDFWSRALGPAPAPQPAPQQGAWWQDPDPYARAQYQGSNGNPAVPQTGQTAANYIRQRRKMGHQNISWDDAEMIAEYDLATKEKYQNMCPECGSGNFLRAGMRVAGTIMPTDKCFDCGHSARGPEPAVGGRGGGGLATRQIDTGGGGNPNMFMVFRGVPNIYNPR